MVHIVWAVGFFEMLMLRTHCLYKTVRYGRSSLAWYNVATKIKKSDHPIYFQFLRIFFIGDFAACCLALCCVHIMKLTESSTPLDYLVNITWIIIQILLLRFTVVDFPYFYIISFNCYIYVKEKMDNLLRDFSEPFLDIDLVPKYRRMVKLVKDVNPLMQLISFTNGLTVIPFFSLIFMLAITYPENHLQLFIKYAHVIPGVIIAFRGVVMTIVLARIDYESKCLYKLIASRIARGNIIGFVTRKQLMFIMDDLSCRRNHLIMREFSGSPSTQMDVMTNVLSIFQFCMLLMEFKVRYF